MNKIDLTTWKRRLHYQIFRNSLQPQYCVSFELDITDFLKSIRRKHYSFTFSFVYAVSKCANEIEEFRCRFLNGEPVLYDRIDTSFSLTWMILPEFLVLKVVNVKMQDTLEEYVSLAKETAASQTEYFTGPHGQ